MWHAHRTSMAGRRKYKEISNMAAVAQTLIRAVRAYTRNQSKWMCQITHAHTNIVARVPAELMKRTHSTRLESGLEVFRLCVCVLVRTASNTKGKQAGSSAIRNERSSHAYSAINPALTWRGGMSECYTAIYRRHSSLRSATSRCSGPEWICVECIQRQPYCSYEWVCMRVCAWLPERRHGFSPRPVWITRKYCLFVKY